MSVDIATCELLATEGPERGRVWKIDPRAPAPTLIGQSPVCEIQLTDPTVSRRHASLEPYGPELRLTDLGSTNGTFVNDVRVAAAFLRGGEVLRCGATLLKVVVGERASVELPAADHFGRLLGASFAMRRIYPLCRKLAASDVPVVIEGETGTGKEVLAESLHDMGPRAKGPFVVFDCTAVAPSLMEAALFGHERGAFTGAVDAKKGVFEQADGGTLLIDEIGDLEMPLQAKLLRALQRFEVRRVGGDRWIRVNVRVLAATRRDLDQEVQHARFRDDLFFRLAVARVELPALRGREGDVAFLAENFWTQLGGTPPVPVDLVRRFNAYSWPGNVRELYNAVARHLALGDLADFGARRADAAPAHADTVERVLALKLPLVRARQAMVEEFERRYVEHMVANEGGNVSAAARAAGVALRYFQLLRAKRAPRG
jgi:DNA-binding NtrC family response regulator